MRSVTFASALLIAASSALGAGGSVIGIGATNQAAPATAPGDGRRVIGVPPLSGVPQVSGPAQRGAGGTQPATAYVLSEKEAQFAVHELALNHPNPEVRAAAAHAHDDDWTVNTELKTFSLVLRDPNPRFVAGTIRVVDNGWRAEFIDEESLAGPWVPPASATLTAEKARGLLQDMCAARAEKDAVVKAMGEGLKGARQEPASGDAVMIRDDATCVCRIDLKARTFSIMFMHGDVQIDCIGKIGWDKNKAWTAWPVMFTRTTMNNGPHAESYLAIPDAENKLEPATQPGVRPATQPATQPTSRPSAQAATQPAK